MELDIGVDLTASKANVIVRFWMSSLFAGIFQFSCHKQINILIRQGSGLSKAKMLH